jgi:hypothetical protein
VEVQGRRPGKARRGHEKPPPENVKTMTFDNNKEVTGGKGLAYEIELCAFRY